MFKIFDYCYSLEKIISRNTQNNLDLRKADVQKDLLRNYDMWTIQKNISRQVLANNTDLEENLYKYDKSAAE